MLAREGITRILKEAQAGNTEYIRKFKENHSNVRWSELRYEKTGDTIIHVASRNSHVRLMEYLLTSEPLIIDCKNNDNKTPLHEAAQFCRYDSAKFLLQNGADVNALKRADWTPLMLACTKILEDSYKLVELLLLSGALVNYRNKDGWTALHLICREGGVEILKLLILYGANFNVRTNNGRTGLHIASLHGNLEIVKELCLLNFDVNTRDSCGNIPLHESVLGNHIDICNELIKRGTMLNICNSADFRLLHLAASQSTVEVIEYVLEELKLDINIVTSKGFSPLHCAARNSRKDVYEFLVKKGANTDLVDSFGRTAADYLNCTFLE